MNQIITVAQVITPILATVLVGFIARKKGMLQPQEVQGLQNYVMKLGLPCILFNSCLTANIGTESLSVMALVIPCVLIATVWAFRARKKQFPYHNLPMLFCAQETGMLGIPLFMILFGAAQAYRIGILDMAQAVICYPTIAILSARSGDTPSPVQIIKNVLTSPFLLCCMAGLFLNLTGIGSWLDGIGIGGILTETTSFLAQPVSAMMIFSVGYNFSMSRENRTPILKISAIHFLTYAVFGVLIQLALFLLPNVDALTRWSILMYSTLPASYLAPSLGRSGNDIAVSSGVCSILTVVSLTVFCIMAAFVA